MTVLAVPARGDSVLRRGITSMGVWSLQRAFNSFTNWNEGHLLTEDGVFGATTEQMVKIYQHDTGAIADGIVGQQTQARLVRSFRLRADPRSLTPRAMIEGLIAGESGGVLSAVNWSVPGGVDCGLTQRRIKDTSGLSVQFWIDHLRRDVRGNVIGPDPMLLQSVKFPTVTRDLAFDSLAQVKLYVNTLLASYKSFLLLASVQRRMDKHEYAWRLAALAHNWPAGASTLAKGEKLSETRRASWVPIGTKFEDGAAVLTWSDWAKFYAMGSAAHGHRGYVVREAFGVPKEG